MRDSLVFSLLKSGFDLEIDNRFEIVDNLIYVYFDDGTKAVVSVETID